MQKDNNGHDGDINKHIERIGEEFRQGFEFLKKYPRSVTIFGSSVAQSNDPNYRKAEELGFRVAKDLGYAVITGGGPGIMEAANKGACQSRADSAGSGGGQHTCSIQGLSAGLTISLPNEHSGNGFSEKSLHFSYFFSRKAMLIFAAEAYVFFPGGYGTFDELFGLLTLIQTGKIPRVPLLLFDSRFWNPVKNLFKSTMLDAYNTIDTKDLTLFEITDSIDHVLETIRKAPTSDWWRTFN